MPYSAPDYWSDLHRRDNVSAVGQSALAPEINRWLYRILARNLRAFVRRRGLVSPPPARLFEVGSGIGEWIPFWRDLGVARIDGCDLVPAAVERLTRRFGDTGTFVVAELGDPSDAGLPADQGYPLVTVFNVLLHITDDERFVRALSQIARLVQPGGSLLLVEPMLRDASYARPFVSTMTSRARPVDAYVGPLLAAGLEQVDLLAAMVLANNPIEAGSRAAFRRYERVWNWVARRTTRSPASARWIGPMLSVGDRIALLAGSAPTSKIALFRRPA
jgi:SAM-dependent methyltransferase